MPILTNSNDFIKNEFSNLNLGDKRLNRRVLDIVKTINAGPSLSIPAMANGHDGQLKGIYRFFQNPKINDQNVLQSHYLNTIERMESYPGKILLINDSCFVTPAKAIEGLLTRGKGKDNCVRTHYCLACSDDGKHLLGLLDFQVLSDPINERHPELRNESDIWIMTAGKCIELIHSSSKRKDLLSRCLFIADREGDEFELINFLIQNKLGFIIRSQYNRNILFRGGEHKLDEIEKYAEKHGESYPVKIQSGGDIEETLVQRCVLRNIEIIPPVTVEKHYGPIRTNVVIVKEVPGQKVAVKWRLLTSEEIDNVSTSLFIVTSYSHRWKIEEVNKAAKTGVRIEERQFTDLSHFIPFLAVAFVVAWRMVALRTVVEISPNTPLDKAFASDEIAYMKVQAKKLELTMKTVKDGLLLIARLGGFTRRYERPGWQILWQGWMKFYERVAGFVLAREEFE